MLAALSRRVHLSSLTAVRAVRFFAMGADNGEPAPKKKIVQIGTHDGIFHCDDALACFLLKRLPRYADAAIVRSRDMDVLNKCDLVVDVGGVYDPSINRYDHHQRDFAQTMDSVKPLTKSFSIKLSSAGLVYAHFGEEILREYIKLPDDAIRSIYEKIYEYFICEIDAIDNGVSICDGEQKYKISTNVSSRVGNLNPQWNSGVTKPPLELFESAMNLVGGEFMECINYYSAVWWPAKLIVKNAINDRLSVHSSGKIIELDSSVPWKQHFFDLEAEMKLTKDITYCIFQASEFDWRVMAVPIDPTSFQCRLFLKEEWRGLRSEELSKISGIPDCIFCHHAGFIGGNRTREGALKMAIKSLGLE